VRTFHSEVKADSVLLTRSVTKVTVTKVITFPNVVDMTIIDADGEYMCAHLSLSQVRELIAVLAEALTTELTL
jgi:hypothetical protein